MPAHRISEYYQCALASQIASRTMVLEHWEPVGRRVNFKLHAGFIVYFIRFLIKQYHLSNIKKEGCGKSGKFVDFNAVADSADFYTIFPDFLDSFPLIDRLKTFKLFSAI